MLWTQAIKPQGRIEIGPWNAAEGYETREECVKGEQRLQAQAARDTLEAKCLPDTVDPRGPRRK